MDDDQCDEILKMHKSRSMFFVCLDKKWEQKSARQTFSLRQRHEGINKNKRNQLFLFPHHRQRKEFNSFVSVILELLVIFWCDFERGLFDHADSSPITISLTAIFLKKKKSPNQ
jgi:hypothetical protein